jgi:hypothetical protein
VKDLEKWRRYHWGRKINISVTISWDSQLKTFNSLDGDFQTQVSQWTGIRHLIFRDQDTTKVTEWRSPVDCMTYAVEESPERTRNAVRIPVNLDEKPTQS